MIRNIRASFISNIATLDWMDAKTKKAAVDKVIHYNRLIELEELSRRNEDAKILRNLMQGVYKCTSSGNPSLFVSYSLRKLFRIH